jgi:hypothetical protein
MEQDLVSATAWLHAHEEEHVGAGTADLNQYWYSASTVGALLAAVREGLAGREKAQLDVAFVSTPSLYFSLPTDVRARCRVLDLDEALGESEPGFVRYDFNRPTELPESLRNAFAMVVIDPPYITEDVWRQYVATAKWLLDGDAGRVLCTTVIENAPLLKSALGAQPNVYLPSIPQLPYQCAPGLLSRP